MLIGLRTSARKATVTPAVAAALTIAALFAAVWTLDALTGVPWWTAAVSAALLSINAGAWASLWHWLVRPTRSIVEFAGIGIAGTVVASALAVTVTPFTWPRVLVFLPGPAIAIVVALRRRTRGQAGPLVPLDASSLGAAAVAAGAALLINRWQWQAYDLASPSGFMAVHLDTVFFELLAQANGQFGQAQLGVLSDWPIRYHWLSYGIVGSLEEAAGSTPFAELTRSIPFFLVMGLALLAAGWARSISTSRWVPLLAALSVCVGRLVADPAGVAVNWNSPSQMFASVVLLGFALVLTGHKTRPERPAVIASITGVTVFVLVGLKVSTAAVAVAGLLALAIGEALRGRFTRRTLTVLGVGVASAAVAWLVFVSGQSAGGGLQFNAPPGISAGLDTWALWGLPFTELLLAVVPGVVGIAYAVRSPRVDVQRAAFAAIGMLAAGLVVVLVLVEARPNTVWFINAAVVPAWVVASVGAGEALARLRLTVGLRRRSMVWLLIVSVALAVMWGWCVVRIPDLRIAPQTCFLILWISVGAVVGLVLWGRTSNRAPAVVIACIVVLGSMSVVTNLVAERLFAVPLDRGGVIERPVSSGQERTAPGRVVSVGEADVAAVADYLGERALAGDGVVLFDDLLLPAAAISQTRPFVSLTGYAEDLGPSGTNAEVQRRFALAQDGIAGDPSVTVPLCDEGVRWVVAPKRPESQPVQGDWEVLGPNVAVHHLACPR